MVPLERLQTLLEGRRSDSVSDGSTPQTTATLYECSVCETVYISEAMEECPECDADLTRVPDERELGLGP